MRDTGAGIAPEMLPRVFEPFTQADTRSTAAGAASGSGSRSSRGSSRCTGARSSVESEGLGKGAEFTVRLAARARLAAGDRARPSSWRQNGPRRRVLVIEDNIDAAESLREVLELEGHTVEVAYSGAEGIEKARVVPARGRPLRHRLAGDGWVRGRQGDARRAGAEFGGPRGLDRLRGTGGCRKVRRGGFDHHVAKPPTPEKLEELLAKLPRPRASAGSSSE